MGDLKGSFAPRYEAIIFATKGRYELPGKRPDDLIACAKVGNQSLTHPNEKPVALLEQLIEATTIPGALILDPFAGSGSTLAAAAKTGRQYIGIEIDEQYSKLAAARAAEHHQKGETTRAIRPPRPSLPSRQTSRPPPHRSPSCCLLPRWTSWSRSTSAPSQRASAPRSALPTTAAPTGPSARSPTSAASTTA